MAARSHAPIRSVVVVVAILICVAAYILSEVFLSPTDAFVYLAAGERLNAGHDLYAIGPGDRIIGLNPPYWTVPTLSPPLLGVLWQPLALAGVAGMLIGWSLVGAAYLVVVGVVVWRSPLLGLIFTAILAPYIGTQIGLGNVNGFVALGMLGMWRLRSHAWVVGVVLALIIAIKVVPVVLALWLLAARRTRALLATAVAGGAVSVLSLLTAGVGVHIDYVGVILHTMSTGSSTTSVAGLATTAGFPRAISLLAPWAVLIGGFGLMRLIRSREDVTFGLSVVLMLLVSPALQPYWFAMAIVVLAPISDYRRATAGPSGLEHAPSGPEPGELAPDEVKAPAGGSS